MLCDFNLDEAERVGPVLSGKTDRAILLAIIS